MIDLERETDVEFLRQVAKIQDVEIHRLHEKIQRITRELVALQGGDSSSVEAQLRLLQKELEDERLIVQNLLNTDPFLSAHCAPLLYEFEPASVGVPDGPAVALGDGPAASG